MWNKIVLLLWIYEMNRDICNALIHLSFIISGFPFHMLNSTWWFFWLDDFPQDSESGLERTFTLLYLFYVRKLLQTWEVWPPLAWMRWTQLCIHVHLNTCLLASPLKSVDPYWCEPPKIVYFSRSIPACQKNTYWWDGASLFYSCQIWLADRLLVS